MFDASQFTVSKPKPIPVLLLLDTSGSMSGSKITALNTAVRKMLGTFRKAELESEVLVSIITFGAEVKRAFPFTPVSQVQFEDLGAYGGTPLGVALRMAKAMLEDRDETPSRIYRPTVVLVSDGQPTDSWEKPLEEFISGGRSSKCDRMAMGIGADADKNVLARFIQGTDEPLFEAESAEDIVNFFKKVTMSVTQTVGGSVSRHSAPSAPSTPSRSSAVGGSAFGSTGSAAGTGASQPQTSTSSQDDDYDSFW